MNSAKMKNKNNVHKHLFEQNEKKVNKIKCFRWINCDDWTDGRDWHIDKEHELLFTLN